VFDKDKVVVSKLLGAKFAVYEGSSASEPATRQESGSREDRPMIAFKDNTPMPRRIEHKIMTTQTLLKNVLDQWYESMCFSIAV